jgi:hypothetical protein
LWKYPRPEKEPIQKAQEEEQVSVQG